jgi:hydroxyacylglutathione hydrolase
MWLAVFNANPYGTNCWLLASEGSDDAVVVDPGFEPQAVEALLDGSGKSPVAILATHAHMDHAGRAGDLAGEVPVYVHAADAVAFTDEPGWNAGFDNPLVPVKDLRTISDGDELAFGGFSIEVLHTPGHTPGHCCFRIEGEVLLLSGDLLFAGSIGRSDFTNSDPIAMRASLRRALMLADDVRVLPGHGPETTIGQELATNPFLRELADG